MDAMVDGATYQLIIVSVGDEEYQRYIKDLGLNYDDAKDKIILVDDFERYVYNEDGSYKKYVGDMFDYKNGDEITFSLSGDSMKVASGVTTQIIASTTQKPMGFEASSYNRLCSSK